MTLIPGCTDGSRAMFGECGVSESTGASLGRQPTADESCLLAHWYDIRSDSAIPLRADLDPSALGPIHARLMLVEMVDGELMIRIAGSEIERAFGRSLHRVRCTQMFRPDTCPRLNVEFATGVGATGPHWSFGSLAEIGRDWVSYRRLTVPFAQARNGAAAYLLSLFTFTLPKIAWQPKRSLSVAGSR